MKTTITHPLADSTFYKTLVTAVTNRQFVRLEYLTDLNEFIKADMALRELLTKDGAESVELASGDTVPLERIVSVSGQLSPLFPGYANYSCDC